MTDHRQPADEALHKQREWMRVTLASLGDTLSSIGDAVITTDLQGHVTFLNPVAQSLTGWTQEDAVGKPLNIVFRIVNEETRRTVENPATRALREGMVVGLANHTVLIAKDGSERPVDDSAAPIRHAQGEIGGVVLVFRDVTERRRHEQQVQDSLTYADNIISTLREPFVVLDEKLLIKTANRAFYEMFQAQKEGTEGRFIFDLGDGQWNLPRLKAMLDEVLSDHHPIHDFDVEFEFPLLGKKIMLLNARRFESVKGQPGLILLAIEDITERKQAEIGVQASEMRYRRLFESAQDGIFILDANTLKITDANPFMTELLGYTYAEFLGKELWEIGFFGDKQASQAMYRELQEKGYVRYDHLPLENKNGASVEVEFVSNVYQVDHRRVAQCNIRDVSERSRLERKTQEQAEALVDLHRRKDEFLAMLSHELRNPLASISNAAQLLRLQKSEDQLQHQARSIIERQLMQLTRLVDDLMEVSRITTGRVQLRRDWLSMTGIVERAVETARPLMEQRRHELTVTLPLQPVWLFADAARLEQVVVNLLTNAAKYTDEGGHVWLSVREERAECVLRVRDTGVGIAPELLPRVFDLFTQAERTLDRSQGGLGIGLALVQRLVELHGGTVEASSVLGRGSEFVVRLPVKAIPAPQPTLPHKPAVPVCPSLRVLVVDDNVDSAQSLAMLLTASHHQVRTVYDGPTALEAALGFRPDVVLLDIGLPRMDGYEVARRLRKDQVLGKVMLVAMTGYGQDADRERSQAAGFNHHLVKPADFAKVQQILATVSSNPS